MSNYLKFFLNILPLFFVVAEIADRELNDEELDKIASKDDIRRELSSLLEAAKQEEDMKRTVSHNVTSGKEATRTKVKTHFQMHTVPYYFFISVL